MGYKIRNWKMELRHLLGYGLVLFGTVMLTLSPYSFDVTQLKAPTTRKRALPHRERARSIVIFIGKFLCYLGLSALFISLGLIIDLPKPRNLDIKLTGEFIEYKRGVLQALR